MSFCCGASMIGTKGTLKHYRTHIHNVPLLLCPICHRVEVHHRVECEYEILAEYAHADGTKEIDFTDYMEKHHLTDLYENCVSKDSEEPLKLIQQQIDMALDLLNVAKFLQDDKWDQQLKRRLAVLSLRKSRILKKNFNPAGDI